MFRTVFHLQNRELPASAQQAAQCTQQRGAIRSAAKAFNNACHASGAETIDYQLDVKLTPSPFTDT
eukprot:2944018-Pleurochrysis_carterae.AAC.2